MHTGVIASTRPSPIHKPAALVVGRGAEHCAADSLSPSRQAYERSTSTLKRVHLAAFAIVMRARVANWTEST